MARATGSIFSRDIVVAAIGGSFPKLARACSGATR